MHFFSYPKCFSYLGHNHGGHVCPIVKDGLWDIDAFLQKIIRWRVELEGFLNKRCVMNLSHQESLQDFISKILRT
jgi:hypothetical protein